MSLLYAIIKIFKERDILLLMSNYNQAVHHTTTKKVASAGRVGWEFECPICGYRARYISPSASGPQQLEILYIGDPQARHMSNQAQGQPVKAWAVAVINEDDDDEAWLTPELRQQMEELLKDVDMGDWGRYL